MKPLPKAWVIVWFALIAALWIVRGLPWNLEEYDQAKQAYTSSEMIERGAWWYQHTPRQESATKPPLVGWMSAAAYKTFGSWDIAWRLPSFLAAVGILLLLWRSGNRISGWPGALLATAAFAWNLLAIRLATMVRTDMVLAFFIFGAGWLIWARLEDGKPWTFRDTLRLSLILAGATMTKGPIYHAFLLPGLLVWLWLAAPNLQKRPIILGYFVASLISLLPFLAWTEWRILHDPSFYDQVVVKEFLGRFTVGEHAVHNNQTWYFYLPHLVTKCLPWSFFFLIPLGFPKVRATLKAHPAALWLVCWTLGGVLAMSLVPSKRVDRIFPVVAPAALCLAAFYPIFLGVTRNRRRLVSVLAVLGAVGYGTYTVSVVRAAQRNDDRRLVTFCHSADQLCRLQNWKFSIVESRDEGVLLYARQPSFRDLKSAIADFRGGSIQAAIVDSTNFPKLNAKAGPLQIVLQVAHPSDKNYFYYLVRPTLRP